jgi:hypothetical protein
MGLAANDAGPAAGSKDFEIREVGGKLEARDYSD